MGKIINTGLCWNTWVWVQARTLLMCKLQLQYLLFQRQLFLEFILHCLKQTSTCVYVQLPARLFACLSVCPSRARNRLSNGTMNFLVLSGWYRFRFEHGNVGQPFLVIAPLLFAKTTMFSASTAADWTEMCCQLITWMQRLLEQVFVSAQMATPMRWGTLNKQTWLVVNYFIYER